MGKIALITLVVMSVFVVTVSAATVQRGVDFDRLGSITITTGSALPTGCSAAQVAKYNATLGNWYCDIDDGSSASDSNETVRFENLVANDCPGGELVIGVQSNGSVLCASDSTGSSTNIFDQELNTTFHVVFAGVNITSNLYSNDWSNVTITESQITDLTHTTDTNESTRVNNLVGNCTSGQLVFGFNADGSKVCVTDSGGGGNPFDQELNTTEDVVFRSVNASNWGNVTITESQISDLDHIGNDEITLNILNITGVDDNACTGTDKVTNVTFTNGNLVITCAADVDTGGGGNPFNQELNTTEYVVFAGVNVTDTLYSVDWSNVTITESQITDLSHTVDTNESTRFDALQATDCTGTDKVTGVLSNGTVVCESDEDSGTTNIFDQELNTTEYAIFAGINVTNKLFSVDWSNVTITESQITDLTHTTDTNESTRVNNLVGNCTSGQLVFGFNADGSKVCVTDQSGGSTNWTNNAWLNETQTFTKQNTFQGIFVESNISRSTDDNTYLQWAGGDVIDLVAGDTNTVTFRSVSTEFNSGVRFEATANCDADNEKLETSANGQLSCGVAVDTDTNETVRLTNLVGADCPGGELVIGVQANGTVLCATDNTGSSTNIFDQELNTTFHVIFAGVNVTSKLFSVDWSNVTITESQITDLDHIGNNEITLTEANITDLSHTVDTNESTRLNNFFGNQCPTGQVMNGTTTAGAIVCITDATGAGGGFTTDQNDDLNTTGNPTFQNITNDYFNTTNYQWRMYDDGSDLILDASAVGGNNHFLLRTQSSFLEIWGNPGAGNDYEIFSFEEVQGDDTNINFYEGGTGHNRIWNSGSLRIGGGKSSLCSNLTSAVDCDTGTSGADLVVEDDIWAGGSVITETSLNYSTNAYTEYNGSCLNTYVGGTLAQSICG